MFLFLIILVATVYFLGVAIYLRVSGMKHKAVCLDYLSGWKAVITHVLYEYELIIAGKTLRYKNWGDTVFFPQKGKKYTVLISKRDYTKVSGYTKYVVYLCLGCFLCILTFADLILY